MTFDPKADPTGYRILTYFGLGADSASTWRSTSGVARDSDIAFDIVLRFLNDHSEYFLESPIQPGGVSLYKARPDIQLAPRST